MGIKNPSRTYSAELEGVNARIVEVEVDMNVGLHSFNIVGLPDKALSEARERVNSALKNSGMKPPNRENRKITINLAPAGIKKAGPNYDLAIALGYLLATKQIAPFATDKKLFVAELALDGRLRPVNGALNITEAAMKAGFAEIFLPQRNAGEAAAIDGIAVISVESLAEAIAHCEGRKKIGAARREAPAAARGKESAGDLADIAGQGNAKRALVIAAAGGHNLLMIGPPGVGKSMLAHALPGILPDLTREEAVEVTKIWSAAGLCPGTIITDRPFRAVHHTSSTIAVLGGGSDPRPGEISLAHRGALFLDELPEFPRSVLEALREPLESGSILISRSKQSLVFPAKFALIAAMNPCPCGYYGDPEGECKCSAYEVVKYQKKISGPLLDRIDIQIKVGRIKIEALQDAASRENTGSAAREAVARARDAQAKRFADSAITTNAEMTSREAEEAALLDPRAKQFMGTLDARRLSPRGYYRVLKVARTIADIESSTRVSAEHAAEAFSYRLRDLFSA